MVILLATVGNAVGEATDAAAGQWLSTAAGSPHGDRVKTDARDAELLAHLLKLVEIVAVNVPSMEQEAARDLGRAREDARGDLMRARHRVWKMLLRQWILYAGGDAWTKVHDSWLRGQRFDKQSRQLAYNSAYEAMGLTVDRRDRLDRAIDAMAANSSYTPSASWTPHNTVPGPPCWLRRR